MRPSTPDSALKAVQTPLAGELFWAVIDDVGARRIVLVAGKDRWPGGSTCRTERRSGASELVDEHHPKVCYGWRRVWRCDRAVSEKPPRRLP